MRGAFTGAIDYAPRSLEYANGGTVFLDEVGETSLAMQAKLLRVIQNREIQRVGSPEVRQVNVRLIAATKSGFTGGSFGRAFSRGSFLQIKFDQIRIPSLMERFGRYSFVDAVFLEEI